MSAYSKLFARPSHAIARPCTRGGKSTKMHENYSVEHMSYWRAWGNTASSLLHVEVVEWIRSRWS